MSNTVGSIRTATKIAAWHAATVNSGYQRRRPQCKWMITMWYCYTVIAGLDQALVRHIGLALAAGDPTPQQKPVNTV